MGHISSDRHLYAHEDLIKRNRLAVLLIDWMLLETLVIIGRFSWLVLDDKPHKAHSLFRYMSGSALHEDMLFLRSLSAFEASQEKRMVKAAQLYPSGNDVQTSL